jgi:hypothetical protein
MRIAASKQAVVVRMPAADLGCLCFLPEVQRLMARFPQRIKVNLISQPYFLALSRQVVPFVLATTGDAPALHRVRRSLRAAVKEHPQDR